MFIIDLDGKKLEITDLQLAILQADDYHHYTISDAGEQAFMEMQKAYWEDVYFKLLVLEKEE